MQSLHFDYSFALPGEESADLTGFHYDLTWGYRIFRLDSTIEASGAPANGVLGIYNLESGLDPLTSGTQPRTSEYIPQWTFIVNDLYSDAIHMLWDLGVGVSFGGISVDLSSLSFNINAPGVYVDITPATVINGVRTILNLLTDTNLMADLWWNDQVQITPPSVPLSPTPIVSLSMSVSLTINTVKDYVDQNPTHLWGPVTLASPVDFGVSTGWTHSWNTFLGVPYSLNLNFNVGLTIDVPGFHRMADHQNPF